MKHDTVQRGLRRIATMHAATRLAIGSALLIAPSAGRHWFGRDVATGGGRVALQAFAVRETALGIGMLRSLRHHQPVRQWFALGLAFELVDAGATLHQRAHLPDNRVPDAVALFALSGIAGGAAVALFLDE